MNIVITHGYSDSNKGDLAIVLGTIEAIKLYTNNASITLQSVYSINDPDFDYHTRFIQKENIKITQMAIPSPYIGTEKLPLGDLRALIRLTKDVAANLAYSHLPSWLTNRHKQWNGIRSIESADIVIAKGGQYIYNDQGGIRGLLYLWRMLAPIVDASKRGKKVILLGHSIGPLTSKRAKRMTKSALAKSSLIVVREKLSQKLLMDELGIEAETVVAPDLAFAITPKQPNSNINTDLGNDKWLGVTLVNWSFPKANNPSLSKANYIQEIVTTCKEAHKRHGLSILLVPQVTVRHHGESDQDIINVLRDKLQEMLIPTKLISDDLSPSELSWVYGKCELLLGTRLHSCILSACSGTPVYAISYQGYKTEGVMSDLGLSEYVSSIYSLNSKTMLLGIEKIIKNRAELSSNITKNVESFRKEIKTLIETHISNTTPN